MTTQMDEIARLFRAAGMSHIDTIERMLRAAGVEGVCATTFLALYMPTYSQRIGELKRRKGLNIITRRCALGWPHTQHNSTQRRYYLMEWK